MEEWSEEEWFTYCARYFKQKMDELLLAKTKWKRDLT